MTLTVIQRTRNDRDRAILLKANTAHFVAGIGGHFQVMTDAQAKAFPFNPFDLTKVRLQSQVLDSTARFSGPIDCLTQTWGKEGLRGLYRVRCTLFGSTRTSTK